MAFGPLPFLGEENDMNIRKDKPGLDATKAPTALDVAWAAGIYEGEGSCVASGRKGKSFSVTVSQKDPELLYRMREFFGGGIRLYYVGKQGRFEIYHWVICGDRARAFLGTIYPFLTARRKAQIDSTSVRTFLDYASDLLVLNNADGPSDRYQALRARMQRFVGERRIKSAAKLVKYRDTYYQQKSQDPAWMEKRRLATQQWRKTRKEQRQVPAQKIVAIA
jgi:hypothetical protein